jgi:hypothetical protein
MLAQDRCSRPHDAATCKSAYAGDEWFKKNLDSYVEVAKANGNKVPSKEQLQDAGLLPKWSTGTGGRGGGGLGRGGRAQGRGEGNANMAGGGSPSPGKAKFDPTRAVVVFAGKSQGHQVVVLDPKDVLMEEASYVSTAGSTVPKAGKAAGTEDSKIERKGTFAENKGGVVACQGQAVALMAKCQPASLKVQSATSLSNRFSPLIKGSSGRYGLCVTSLGGAPVVAASGNAGKEGTKAVSANHFDIPLVPSSFVPVSSYNASAVPAPGSGSIKVPLLSSESGAQSGTGKGKGLAHWNQCDLAVQCTDSMCQINMGTFLVLLIAPTCADTDGMRCVVLAPKGLKGQRRTSFLEEGTKQFQAHMGRKTASKN